MYWDVYHFNISGRAAHTNRAQSDLHEDAFQSVLHIAFNPTEHLWVEVEHRVHTRHIPFSNPNNALVAEQTQNLTAAQI